MAPKTVLADISRNLIEKGGAIKEDVVEVDISYDIIRQFSAQLYTNPRKAIEELICNSYDAGANVCYVVLPKAHDSLLVLDDGKSMDLNGLKDLWKVAYSPKDKGEATPRIENDRLQIGKFGVGKLAAFALGERLTHVTCVDGNVRVVSVGQIDLKQKKSGEPPKFEVYKMDLSKAIPILGQYFKDVPKPWEIGWDSWTLAIIDKIDKSNFEGRALRVDLLHRMITTALPISARFKIFIGKEEVHKKKIDPKEIRVKVECTDLEFRKKLQESLREYWKDVLHKEKSEDVPETYYKLKIGKVQNPQNISGDKLSALIVPGLGPIIGNAIFTKTYLTTDKVSERGYVNNGFAIHSHGKLINPEDELFGVTARSHSFWARFLADVEIPNLDNVLLVQRNAVSEKTNEAQIARRAMLTLFNYTRAKVEEIERKEKYKPESFGSRLNTYAPLIASLAQSGLSEGVFPKKGIEELDVDFSTLGETGPAARYDPQEEKILINLDHPLITALDDPAARSKKALRRVICEVLAGTQMATGYLRSQNVPEKIVYETGEILESSIRSAAGFVINEIEVAIKAINDASYQGDTPFENAVIEAFQSLRLAVTYYGGSDEPDGIIEIPISGGPNLRISVEAKGSEGVITHEELATATVERHGNEFGCEHAIAIAREFATEGIGEKDAALLRETKGKVPLITTEGIAHLLKLHKKRPFTTDKIAKILTTWKHPDDLINFIDQTWKEMPDLGLMRLVLTIAEELSLKDDTNYPEPGMILNDDRIRSLKLPKSDLISILEALSITTHMVLIRNKEDFQFELIAPCDTILESLQREVGKES